MILDYLIKCFFGLLVCLISSTAARIAIIGGEKSDDNHLFPYQVSVQLPNHGHHCGGGIVGEKFILTAAHCAFDDDGRLISERISALVGTNDLDKTTESTANVDFIKIYIPKDYVVGDSDSFGDIALFELKHALKLSKHVQKLELPEDGHDFLGKTARIAGFGGQYFKSVSGEMVPAIHDSHLRFGVVDVLNSCHKHSIQNIVDAKEICARMKHDKHSGTRGVCHGDSGGPLVHEHTVIGILSQGPLDCSEHETGALYTRVSHYREFIHQVMKHEPPEGTRIIKLHH